MGCAISLFSDINECEKGTHDCAGTLAQCVNRPGTYICQCPNGYQLNQATRQCEGKS